MFSFSSSSGAFPSSPRRPASRVPEESGARPGLALTPGPPQESRTGFILGSDARPGLRLGQGSKVLNPLIPNRFQR